MLDSELLVITGGLTDEILELCAPSSVVIGCPELVELAKAVEAESHVMVLRASLRRNGNVSLIPGVLRRRCRDPLKPLAKALLASGLHGMGYDDGYRVVWPPHTRCFSDWHPGPYTACFGFPM